MNVVACYKWVIDEADVRVKDDRSVDVSMAKMKISDYDKHALHAAAEIAHETNGKAFGLSYGDARLKKSVKEALSRGLDEVVWVNDSCAAAADSLVTASVLADAVKDLDDVELVVCADGSSDQFARQTAPRIAARLGWPVITGVVELSMADGALHAVRQVDAGQEEVSAALPAVVSVLPELNTPPIPGLRQIMGAGKKPNRECAPAGGAEPKVRVVDELGYASDRKGIMFDVDDEDGVAQFVTALKKEGVL